MQTSEFFPLRIPEVQVARITHERVEGVEGVEGMLILLHRDEETALKPKYIKVLINICRMSRCPVSPTSIQLVHVLLHTLENMVFVI